MRTIVIKTRTYEGEDTLTLAKQKTKGVVEIATGYLALWASHDASVAYVEIDVHHDGELVACYYRDKAGAEAAARGEKGHLGFTLVGVWRSERGEYSFHS